LLNVFILAETDWIAEFAKKQELAEKANKLKVMTSDLSIGILFQ